MHSRPNAQHAPAEAVATTCTLLSSQCMHLHTYPQAFTRPLLTTGDYFSQPRGGAVQPDHRRAAHARRVTAHLRCVCRLCQGIVDVVSAVRAVIALAGVRRQRKLPRRHLVCLWLQVRRCRARAGAQVGAAATRRVKSGHMGDHGNRDSRHHRCKITAFAWASDKPACIALRGVVHAVVSERVSVGAAGPLRSCE